jgi:hypothetical protein
MKLTKKQRAKIYLDAAMYYLHAPSLFEFCIPRKKNESYGEWCIREKKLLPEMNDFQEGYFENRFDIDYTDARLISLLLSHQMCKD